MEIILDLHFDHVLSYLAKTKAEEMLWVTFEEDAVP